MENQKYEEAVNKEENLEGTEMNEASRKKKKKNKNIEEDVENISDGNTNMAMNYGLK